MAINESSILGIAKDSSSVYRKLPAEEVFPSDDNNVFVFTSGSDRWRIIDDKSPYIARLGGIFPGTDATVRLNAIFAHPSVFEVVFDSGAITISGTLNCQNKKIVFKDKAYLTGSGTVNNCVIDASFQDRIFTTTLTVNPSGVTNKYFSVKWFGALGDNTTNDHAAIQSSIYTVIRNAPKVKSIFMPSGKYVIGSPLIMHKWNGFSYQFFNCDLIGETSFWEESSSGTTIRATFSDSFALGIQAAKGVRIKNIEFAGVFNPSFTNETRHLMYSYSYADFPSTVSCRDSSYSPYAGIVIDPFRNQASLPADGGYPGNDGYIGTLPDGTRPSPLQPTNLSAYYRGPGGDAGSTGVTIDDCYIRNFVVGFITSPSGTTRNAELIEINRIQFKDCKACIAGCQSQEKLNRASFLGVWGTCHTVLMFNYYGGSGPSGEVGHWIIENVNLAGVNQRLIYRNEGGYFPMKISNVYAESLGRIGDIDLKMGTTISDCMFDFAMPDLDTKQMYNSVATGVAIFKNCTFRYYGWNAPVNMNGRFVFTECKFETPPILPDEYLSDERYLGTSIQDNCFAGSQLNLNATYPQCVLPTNAGTFYADGKTVLMEQSTSGGGKIAHNPVHSVPHSYIMEILSASKAITRTEITISGTPYPNACVISAGADELLLVNVNDIVGFVGLPGQPEADPSNPGPYKYKGYGRVVAKGGSSYTVAYITNIPNANYRLTVYKPLKFLTFLGDVTSGSNVITNVRIDMGGTPEVNTAFIQNLGAFNVDNRASFVITGWDNGTKQITVNKPFTVTKTGVYFSNNGYMKSISAVGNNTSSSIFSSSLMFQKGGTITFSVDGEPKTYAVTKSGYANPSIVGGGETRQAEWTEVVYGGAGATDFQ